MRCYGDVVWRACLVSLRSRADAEDVYQDTFLRYALADSKTFNGEEHRKAWLIRVAINRARDLLKSASRTRVVSGDEMLEFKAAEPEPYQTPSSLTGDVVGILRAMGDPPRSALFLSLVLEYPAKEIAEMLGAPVNTVYSWIHRGKKALREALS